MKPSLYVDPPLLQKRLRRYEVNGYVFYTVVVEKGSFVMGDDAGEDDEKPAHIVDIKFDYEIGVHPVTQGLWQAVMGSNYERTYFLGDERPVEGISWDDIRGSGGFLDQLNAWFNQCPQMKLGTPFNLPSEAQWEYAARGGRYHRIVEHPYVGSHRLQEVGWYMANSRYETSSVGLLHRNILGLQDMSGNVWEWVEDQWHDNYDDAPASDMAWVDSSGHPLLRVLRGGSWSFNLNKCRVSSREHHDSDFRNFNIGFRLARNAGFV